MKGPARRRPNVPKNSFSQHKWLEIEAYNVVWYVFVCFHFT